jgi:hypothetical protein
MVRMLKIFWKIEDYLIAKEFNKLAEVVEKLEDKYYKVFWTIEMILKRKNIKDVLKLGGGSNVTRCNVLKIYQ